MTVRVLHVVVAGEIGGAERFLVSLANGAPREADGEPGSLVHGIALFTPSEPLAALLRGSNAQVLDGGPTDERLGTFLKRTFLSRDLETALGLAGRFRPDVIHAHTFGSQVLATRLADRLSIPLVRTEHSTRAYVDPSCIPFSLWSLRRAKAAVAVSSYVKRRALSLAPWAASRMEVIRNGVDTTQFPASPLPSERTLRLVVVGRLEPRKGIDRAIDALVGLNDATLAVVGSGESEAALARRVSERGLSERVSFHGYQDDVRPFIAKSHAILSTSREEGLGIALLEGMAMGRPVIGFPVGGVREIVEHGTTGFLTSTQTADGLRACIEKARHDADLSLLGRNARAFVEKEASISAMRAAYGELYARLVAGPQSG